MWVDNSDSLAWGILRLLKDEDHRRWIVENGLKTVRTTYNWENITRATTEFYKAVLEEYRSNDWKPAF